MKGNQFIEGFQENVEKQLEKFRDFIRSSEIIGYRDSMMPGQNH